jgi:phosphoserine phosphatase RsbU/P
MTVATPRRAFNEAQRLEAVRRYDILDTPLDGAFDRVCALA